MEPTSPAIKNTKFLIFWEKMNGARKKATIIMALLTLIAILAAVIIKNPISSSSSSSSVAEDSRNHHLNSVIKKACANTLYASLCFTTLSSISSPVFTYTNQTVFTFHYILEFSINQTKKRVLQTQVSSLSRFQNQDWSSQQQNAIKDCMEMLDQTQYELEQAIDNLRQFPESVGSLPRSYGYLKVLLSAAMTNGYSCIDGLSDLEALDSEAQKEIKKHFLVSLSPISQMISNCLAMITAMEKVRRLETVKNPRMLLMKMPEDRLLDWMSVTERKMMQMRGKMIPDVIVASDGSGNYSKIGEAIAMAPSFSKNRYAIRIKAGIYEENVNIPREKMNLMLLGDGMNSTIITGSRNIVDGFSTFASATLTVLGDKFIAQDLTIINTALPEKHQAVALRVTSNAAFYRCEMISYQDTLYAHSLRQFYRDCSIQGTIDFIFGNAAAVFQNCLILARKPLPGQRNMITAQGREDPNQNTGIILQNCTIKAAPEFTLEDRKKFTTFLGRPWRNFSRTVVIKSYLDDLINPEGWSPWDAYSRLDTVEYIEYLNSGPGSDTKQRVRWGGYRRNCSEDVIERQYTVEAFLQGADNWLETIITQSS